MTEKPRIAITLGDPSGIGPEVVAKALLEKREIYEWSTPFVIGSLAAFESIREHIPSDVTIRAISSPQETSGEHGVIDVLNTDGFEDEPFPLGEHSVLSGTASHTWVETCCSDKL